jgi:glycosyltransferase involved in cell wall biosynthesis
MKICIYIDSQSMGGIETHILQLILGLLESTSYDVDLLFWKNYSTQPNGKHPLIEKLVAANSNTLKRCRFFSANGNIFTLLKYFRSGYTVIHSHGYKAGITARIIGLMTNIPVVSTYHNGDPGSGKLKFYNYIDRVTSFLSVNIAVNSIISQPLQRCRVISNFVNTVDKSCLTKELKSRKSIAFVGRLSHEKGPDVFSTITKDINHPISMYGDGPMLQQLKNECKHISFEGMCDMEQHWQDIRLVIIPSRYEGLPLAALEAMSRGIPVIASTAGALPQLIADCHVGKVIKLEEIAIFKKEIKRLMLQNNDEYVQQGEKLINYINKYFSRQKNIPKIINHYKLAIELNDAA